MASASQLYLLADHVKLSLLERQRAISLNLEPSSQDGHISRSLDSFREGVEALEQQQRQLAGSNTPFVSHHLDARSSYTHRGLAPPPTSKTRFKDSAPNTMT